MIEATSCGGVVIFRGKILVLYKNYKNKYEGWVLPKGTVEEGEEYKETALREVKEEVGLDLPPEGGKLIHSEVRGEGFQDILDVWLFDYNGPLALEKATTQEVAQCRWMDKSEIQALYDSGELVPTLGYVFPLL